MTTNNSMMVKAWSWVRRFFIVVPTGLGWRVSLVSELYCTRRSCQTRN